MEHCSYGIPHSQYPILNNDFGSFMSPELLAQFGLTVEEKEEENSYEEELTEEQKDLLETSPLVEMIYDEAIRSLCSKYKIEVLDWLKFAAEVYATDEMEVA